MQRVLSSNAAPFATNMRSSVSQMRPWDVFINHRGVDTKQTIASLLYDRLIQLNLRPFLDKKSMEPGDKLVQSIGSAIRSCKVGVALFSPRYSESFFCLQELALMVEANKKVIPIFFDVKPSDVRVMGCAGCPPKDLLRIRRALEEASYTVGVTFDSSSGNWSDLVKTTADIILKSLKEEENKETYIRQRVLHSVL
ncbi:probable 2' cyclic ADP-D-ribose synthase BdTIR [Aristolochia californica]|uniref:probable 2' cyclic ADP-D-ribose synthase BdTIR n=1 Tax=Aristolochia californica TaxID=171875 RepID=UPI0035DD0380